jgi:hypothetical protein
VLITKRIYTECVCVFGGGGGLYQIVCAVDTSKRGSLGPILAVVKQKGL